MKIFIVCQSHGRGSDKQSLLTTNTSQNILNMAWHTKVGYFFRPHLIHHYLKTSVVTCLGVVCSKVTESRGSSFPILAQTRLSLRGLKNFTSLFSFPSFLHLINTDHLLCWEVLLRWILLSSLTDPDSSRRKIGMND